MHPIKIKQITLMNRDIAVMVHDIFHRNLQILYVQCDYQRKHLEKNNKKKK